MARVICPSVWWSGRIQKACDVSVAVFDDRMRVHLPEETERCVELAASERVSKSLQFFRVLCLTFPHGGGLPAKLFERGLMSSVAGGVAVKFRQPRRFVGVVQPCDLATAF